MNLENICLQTVDLAREIGEFIKAEQAKLNEIEIETKSLNSLVSYVDKEAEQKIVEGLKVIVPNAGFIAEEGTGEPLENGLNWIIDPLDGTTNFLHGLPEYAISIALYNGIDLLLGVVMEMGQNECFYAWKGGGAYCNGKVISVSENSELSNSLLATGFPYYDFEHIDAYLGLLKDCFQTTRGVRRWGSAAVDLAYVACGRFDGFFEYSLNPWDVAAGILIVQEAGGKVCAFDSSLNPLFDRQITASSSQLYSKLTALISKHLK